MNNVPQAVNNKLPTTGCQQQAVSNTANRLNIPADYQHQVDAVVIGGGIAGLFTLAKLIKQGYRAVLVEKSALGSGQTIKPRYWRDCLAGHGEVDLSACQVLADKQLMWATPNLSSGITGFFASRAMQSHVERLSADKRPAVFQHRQHRQCQGTLYALDEPVIDVRSLLHTFAKRYQGLILTDCHISVHGRQVIANATVKGQPQQWQLTTQKLIVTAGAGNAEYTEQQQLRPLRMLVAEVPRAFGRLYVHVLEASDKPRLTISTYPHPSNSERLIWYIGGNIAEKGAACEHDTFIKRARQELSAVFTWLDWSTVIFDSVLVNRAEGSSAGKRPNTPTIIEQGNQLIAWPTKLALAPLLADSLCQKMSLTHPVAKTVAKSDTKIVNFPPPRIANFVWIKN